MLQGSLFNSIESRNSTWVPSAPPSLDGVDEIALDCETTGLRWYRGDRVVGLAIGYKRGAQYHTQYLPFAHSGGGNLDEAVVKRWAHQELKNKKIKNLNSRFDNHNMYNWGVDLEEQGCVWGDIGHYMGLLHDQRRHGFGLDAIARELIGKGKVKGLDGRRISEYHAGDVDEYARTDVELVLESMDVLRPQLEARGLMNVAQLEDETIYAVCEMERNGSPIDVEKLHLWLREAEREIAECIWKIYKITGLRIEPGDRDSMVRLFRVRNIPIKHWTSGGKNNDPQPSFTDDILAGIEDEVIELVRRARKLISLGNKYLKKYSLEMRKADRIRYSLNQLMSDEGGTISGRFSSSRLVEDDEGSDGINVQQVMRPDKHQEMFGDRYRIRELYIPEHGFQWLSADARQIEYRLFAHYSLSKRLWKAYEADPLIDFHNIVWAILKEFDPDITRKTTKDTNFAKIYGAQVDRISQMLHVSKDKAQEFINIYDEKFPEANALIKRVTKKASDRGYVKTVLGRRFYFPEGQWLHKALSRVIQGTAADIMKTKLNELHKARKNTGFKMRFTVHDEVNGDVPDQESARMVTEILNYQSIPFKVPILWDVGVAANWADA